VRGPDTNFSSGAATVTPSKDVRGLLRPGDRIMVEGSADARKIYTVAAINGAQDVTLSESFSCRGGSANCGPGKVTLVSGYGSPALWVDTVVDGAAQWSYDVFFTVSLWFYSFKKRPWNTPISFDCPSFSRHTHTKTDASPHALFRPLCVSCARAPRWATCCLWRWCRRVTAGATSSATGWRTGAWSATHDSPR
jgi:hypothetical protein